jgi:hypothetical protein
LFVCNDEELPDTFTEKNRRRSPVKVYL